MCLGTKGTPSDFSNSHKLFFPLVCLQNDEKQFFFQSCTNLNGQLRPSNTNSSQPFEKFFCTWLICMASIYHQFFHENWNPTSPNTYNFENCSKLKTSNFEQWQFFISQPNVSFRKPKDPPWNPLQLHQVRFPYSSVLHDFETSLWELVPFMECDNFGQMSIKV